MIHNRAMFLPRPFKRRATISLSIAALLIPAVTSLSSCSGARDGHVQASGPTVTVGVTKVVKKSLGRQLTLSSELVPFQEIDVYAKESGYVKKLMVDYGTHVKAGQVMAILDDREEVMGRKVSGVQVLGSPLQLKQTVEEFSVHGVKIDEVIVSNGENQLAKPVLAELQRICRQKEIELTFLPQLFHSTFKQVADLNNEPAGLQQAATFPISSYFEVKRVLDFVFALLFTALLSPVFICVSVLVALDVGTPLVFWHRRSGLGGRGFQIYKFRTMQSPFDRLGESLPEKRRLSAIGHLLRKTGLDELPQLLNVLAGEMSLVGPRPLMPEDQPVDPTIRLMVRPGITGWAQVNGGKQITNDEKGDLDEWYVRNASPWLDLRILLLTCRYVFVGNRANMSPSTNAKSGVGEKRLDGKAA